MTLAGRTAVITGAASGIGRATAALFGAEGASLVLVDRDGEALEALQATLASQGVPVLSRVSDVADAQQVGADAVAAIERFGGTDILVTAAGFSTGGTVLTTSLEDWHSVIAANLTGTMLWSRAVIPTMQAAGHGTIVTIASQLALAGGRGNCAYLAAKGAILSLTRTMALDFAADGIRVNAVVPGAIDTPLLARGFARADDPDTARERSRARHAMGRFGDADEVARAILFLAGEQSSFTTGSTLMVDGGWLAA